VTTTRESPLTPGTSVFSRRGCRRRRRGGPRNGPPRVVVPRQLHRSRDELLVVGRWLIERAGDLEAVGQGQASSFDRDADEPGAADAGVRIAHQEVVLEAAQHHIVSVGDERDLEVPVDASDAQPRRGLAARGRGVEGLIDHQDHAGVRAIARVDDLDLAADHRRGLADRGEVDALGDGARRDLGGRGRQLEARLVAAHGDGARGHVEDRVGPIEVCDAGDAAPASVAPPATTRVPIGTSATTVPVMVPRPSGSAISISPMSVADDSRWSGSPEACDMSMGRATRGAMGKVRYAWASARRNTRRLAERSVGVAGTGTVRT
jgi:hypothetical protein